MRVIVIGTGAIGGVLAGYLSAAGHAVVATDGWDEHVRAIRENGLLVTGARGSHQFRLEAINSFGVSALPVNPDLVLLCVKSYDTAQAAELVAPLLGAETTVMSTQNGLNEDLLSERFGSDRVVGAVTEMGGYIAGPGEIVETRADGGFVIGELDGSDTPRVREVEATISACAPTIVTPTIRGLLWSKLTWNCVMNPITAVTGLGQGEVWAHPQLRALAVNVAHEAAAVACAEGVALEPLSFLGVDLPSLVADDQETAGAASDAVVGLYESQLTKTTSMLEDIRHGRCTEVDFLNGHVVRRGEELGVPTPLNSELVRLVHAVESAVEPQRPDLLDRLAEQR
jgi:2-dehydropantoate 2-reductase